MIRRVWLLRHGKTEANEKRLYCGSTDLPLSSAGRAELKALAAAGGYPHPAGLQYITSGLRRTAETLELLYGPVACSVCPLLREMDFGAFEMHSYDQLKDDAAYQAWITGDNEKNRCPGGESGEEMRLRVLAGWKQVLERPEKELLLVLHGGPIAAIVEHLEPELERNRWLHQPENGRGWLLTLEGDRLLKREPFPEGI